MAKIFTMTRNGLITTSKKTPNQCKTPGHTGYEYTVKLKCGPKLDNQGFLIDHNIIHDEIVKATKQMNSCENLCIAICDATVKTMRKHKAELYHVHVTLKPVISRYESFDQSKNFAFMEYEETPDSTQNKF